MRETRICLYVLLIQHENQFVKAKLCGKHSHTCFYTLVMPYEQRVSHMSLRDCTLTLSIKAFSTSKVHQIATFHSLQQPQQNDSSSLTGQTGKTLSPPPVVLLFRLCASTNRHLSSFVSLSLIAWCHSRKREPEGGLE